MFLFFQIKRKALNKLVITVSFPLLTFLDFVYFNASWVFEKNEREREREQRLKVDIRKESNNIQS